MSDDAWEQQVKQATAYAEEIVIESDGYPMSHSAAAMRTLLANAYLAGAEAAVTAGQGGRKSERGAEREQEGQH